MEIELNEKQKLVDVVRYDLNQIAFVYFKTYKRKMVCAADEKVVHDLNFVLDECYEKGIYARWNVKDKVVVDVGSFYGDTAIYFLENGAKRVLCFEPYVSAYFIQANVLMNIPERTDDVDVYNFPITGSKRNVKYRISAVNYGGTRWQENETDNGLVESKSVDLRDICTLLDGNNNFLKLDCEGYEHEVLETAQKEDMDKFDSIIMESHGGYEDCVKNLEAFGFKCEYERYDKDTYMIWAKRV